MATDLQPAVRANTGSQGAELLSESPLPRDLAISNEQKGRDMRVTETWPVPRMRPAAAGPITVTKYKGGKPVSVTVLPPPGERDSEPRTGDWRMTVSKRAPERPPLDQSTVSEPTKAKRRKAEGK